MKGRSVFAVEHGRSRLAAVGAAYAAFHGIAVLGILALLAVTAALDGHISLRPPSWLVDVAAPWVTVVLVGLGVLPALGIAAAVQVFEVRRGVASSPALLLSWVPSLVSAAVLVVVSRGLGWIPGVWLVGECVGALLTGLNPGWRTGGKS